MPLDHFSLTIPASKVDGLVSFLTTSLHQFGFKEHMRYGPHIVGLGDDLPYFWIAGIVSEDADGKTVDEMLKKQHIAFTAESERAPFLLLQTFGLLTRHHALWLTGAHCQMPNKSNNSTLRL